MNEWERMYQEKKLSSLRITSQNVTKQFRSNIMRSINQRSSIKDKLNHKKKIFNNDNNNATKNDMKFFWTRTMKCELVSILVERVRHQDELESNRIESNWIESNLPCEWSYTFVHSNNNNNSKKEGLKQIDNDRNWRTHEQMGHAQRIIIVQMRVKQASKRTLIYCVQSVSFVQSR